MPRREHLVIQAGNFSNCVGAHFWNLQSALARAQDASTLKEVDMHCLFHERASDSRLVPRLVAFDLEDNFVGLPTHSDMESGPTDTDLHAEKSIGEITSSSWTGRIERMQRRPAKALGRFQTSLSTGNDPDAAAALEPSAANRRPEGAAEQAETLPSTTLDEPFAHRLEQECNMWSDYFEIDMPPESAVSFYGTSSLSDRFFGRNAPFSAGRCSFFPSAASPMRITSGVQTYDGMGRTCGDEAIEDSIRRQLEMCDAIDCVTVFSDLASGFGGFSVDVLEYLRTVTKSTLLTFGLHSSQDSVRTDLDQKVCRLNRLLAMDRLGELSSMYVPVSVPSSSSSSSSSSRCWKEYASFYCLDGFWPSSASSSAQASPCSLPVAEYFQSALIGTGIETLLSPFRSAPGMSLQDLVAGCLPSPRMKTVGMVTSLPVPLLEGTSVVDGLASDAARRVRQLREKSQVSEFGISLSEELSATCSSAGTARRRRKGGAQGDEEDEDGEEMTPAVHRAFSSIRGLCSVPGSPLLPSARTADMRRLEHDISASGLGLGAGSEWMSQAQMDTVTGRHLWSHYLKHVYYGRLSVSPGCVALAHPIHLSLSYPPLFSDRVSSFGGVSPPGREGALDRASRRSSALLSVPCAVVMESSRRLGVGIRNLSRECGSLWRPSAHTAAMRESLRSLYEGDMEEDDWRALVARGLDLADLYTE